MLYKVELYLLKIIPIVMALLCCLNTVLSYFNIDLPILSYIGGVSILSIVFLYISSYTFKFCSYHRMFLNYIVVINIINIIDMYCKIPISDRCMLSIYLIIAGIFLFIILYLYIKSHRQ